MFNVFGGSGCGGVGDIGVFYGGEWWRKLEKVKEEEKNRGFFVFCFGG